MWRHISLSIRPNGLATENLSLPGGGIAALRLDVRHKIIVESSRSFSKEINLLGRKNASEIVEELASVLLDIGLSTDIDPTQMPDILDCDLEKAATFFHTLVEVDRLFKQHFPPLPEPVSPVQLWPHGFDLSCEWYGGRLETWEEAGKINKIPTQLNLGFYPGANDADSYFYSNPWPFDEKQLLDKSLPTEARWHTEGWKGAILPYTELLHQKNAGACVLEFAKAVFEIAKPTLV